MIRLLKLAQPMLQLLDPEDAHRAAIQTLKLLPCSAPAKDDRRLGITTIGLNFPNPVGLAAGFDKDAEIPDALLGIGFGFVEVGTLTPRPQPGNPRPRAFRLKADRAIINRYGFNNNGQAQALALLENRRRAGIVGVNIGANKETKDRISDYVEGIKTFSGVASYFTINVSSPNTPGLRDLQEADALSELLARVIDARDLFMTRKPVLLKIAPDLSFSQLDAITKVARARGIDGMIVSNTTISRPDTLTSALLKENGGLSGAPLFKLSTQMLAQTYLRIDKQFPLIGVGGIDSPETAIAKIEAGATLLQLYSALVYDGLELVARIKHGLIKKIERDGAPLTKLIGSKASHYQRS
jgi:dihydroorotate dehydrogenase